MNTPKCYECVHRGSAAGSAHSCCNYPGTSTEIFDFFSSGNLELIKKLEIRGHHTGLRNGWFLWPINFDPIWLLNCNGFKKID